MSESLAEIEVRENVVIARVAGDVDIASAEALEAMLVAAVPNGVRGLVVDLTRSRYVDSAGIRVLFALAFCLGVRQQELALVAPLDAPLRTVLGIVGIDAAARVHADLDLAVAAMPAAPAPVTAD